MRIRSTRAICIGFLGTLVMAQAGWAGTLSVRVFDEGSRPVAARVYLTDSRHHPFLAPGTLQYSHCTHFGCEFHFVVPHGSFAIHLPAGTYQLEVARGKEYLPASETLDMPRSGNVARSIHLQRWVKMANQGWYSADMHVHAGLKNLPVLMQAEDLNLALPITRWRLPGGLLQTDPGLHACLAKADANGLVRLPGQRWFSCINEELESASSAVLVSRLDRKPLPLLYPFARFGRSARQRQALADSEKATALELPAEAALGAVDLVGLANNHMWRSGCDLVHWGAWPDLLPGSYPFTCSGFAHAGFVIYYALLQMGFPLKLSAGSAYGVHPVPFGWSRVYVHVPGDFTPERWFGALRQGYSFVTTGPMLLLQANGLEPGEEFRAPVFPLKVAINLKMLSSRPVDSAEIVVNGSAQAVALQADSSHPYAYLGHAQVLLRSSSWIAARYVHQTGPAVEVAHTSPIYFWHGQQPLAPTHAQAEYLRRRVEALIARVKAEPGREGGATNAKVVVDTPLRREETLGDFQEALQIYEQKAQQAGKGMEAKKIR